MKSRIEYLISSSYEESITIENVGNVTLHLFNDFGDEWFIDINTELGWSRTQSFGPLRVDFNDISEATSFQYNSQYEEYSEYRLENRITKFIQDPRKSITQVLEVTHEEAMERLRSIRLGGSENVC